VSDGKTYYQVLGLPSDASPEQVRKRFRELAREHHPDLNRDRPDSHERFLQINEAYETLNDPGRRAAYDLTLRDQARREAERKAGSGAGPAYRPPPRSGPSTRVGTQSRAASPGGDARARREAEQRRQTVLRLMDDARHAYQRGHLREAHRLCKEVLTIGKVGGAYEMLGDIYTRQGRNAEAVEAYTVAAQISPNSSLIMAKLNRAADRQASGRPPSDHEMRIGVELIPRQAYLGRKMSIAFFGAAMVLLLIWLRGIFGEEELGWPLVADWTAAHLILMGASGFIAGAVLASAGWVRPLDQELIYRTIGSGRRPVPIGLVLALVGMAFFPAALLVYGLIAYFQESLSPSVLLAFAATVALTFGFVFAAPSDAILSTFLFGGNVLFTSLLVGWFLGDLFRPSWAL
jgi:curved DNA-binding protein CbpA